MASKNKQTKPSPAERAVDLANDAIDPAALTMPTGDAAFGGVANAAAEQVAEQVAEVSSPVIPAARPPLPMPADPAPFVDPQASPPVPTELPAWKRDGELSTRSISLEMPVYDGVLDNKRCGFTSPRLDFELYGEFGETFRRLVTAARVNHLVYEMGGRVVHVDNGPDLIRYLMCEAARKLKEDC